MKLKIFGYILFLLLVVVVLFLQLGFTTTIEVQAWVDGLTNGKMY